MASASGKPTFSEQYAQDPDPGLRFHEFVGELFALEFPGIKCYFHGGKDGAIDCFDDAGIVWECKFIGAHGLAAARVRWKDVFNHLNGNLLDNAPKQSQYRPWYDTGAASIKRYLFCTSNTLEHQQATADLTQLISDDFTLLSSRNGLHHLQAIKVEVWSWDGLLAKLQNQPHLRLQWFPDPVPAAFLSLESRVYQDKGALMNGNDLQESAQGPRKRVVILTVNPHETSAVLDIFLAGNAHRQIERGGMLYDCLGSYGDYEVLHTTCEMGAGGIGAAQARTRDAIEQFKPDVVLAVGIAFGVDSVKQRIGDVLISQRLQPYEAQRVGQDGIILRGERATGSAVWLQRVRAADNKHRRGNAAWPTVRIGLLLSGEKLIDHGGFRDAIVRITGGEAIGGEMEGAGVYVAAQEKKTDWLIIKGICDWANDKGTNKTSRQEFAARNAACIAKIAIDPSGTVPEWLPLEGEHLETESTDVEPAQDSVRFFSAVSETTGGQMPRDGHWFQRLSFRQWGARAATVGLLVIVGVVGISYLSESRMIERQRRDASVRELQRFVTLTDKLASVYSSCEGVLASKMFVFSDELRKACTVPVSSSLDNITKQIEAVGVLLDSDAWNEVNNLSKLMFEDYRQGLIAVAMTDSFEENVIRGLKDFCHKMPAKMSNLEPTGAIHNAGEHAMISQLNYYFQVRDFILPGLASMKARVLAQARAFAHEPIPDGMSKQANALAVILSERKTFVFKAPAQPFTLSVVKTMSAQNITISGGTKTDLVEQARWMEVFLSAQTKAFGCIFLWWQRRVLNYFIIQASNRHSFQNIGCCHERRLH